MIWELISNQMPHTIHYLKKKKRNDHRNKIKILLIIIIFCWESSWSNIQQCSNAMIKKNCPHSSYTSKHYKTEKYHKTDEVPLQKTKKNDLQINCHSILMKKLISKVPSKCECSGTYEKLYLWLYDQKTWKNERCQKYEKPLERFPQFKWAFDRPYPH